MQNNLIYLVNKQMNTHSKQTGEQDIYQYYWPTSIDYRTVQHIRYGFVSEILAVWLRKGDRSSDTEGGDGTQITTRVKKEGERRCRKERRRILVGVSGLVVACWQETPLQLECGMLNIYSFKTQSV